MTFTSRVLAPLTNRAIQSMDGGLPKEFKSLGRDQVDEADSGESGSLPKN